MSHSPSIIANAFLYAGGAQNIDFDHLKLQKMVFFAHAWSLVLQGQSVVNESPQAWTFGPVFDSIYQRLAHTRGKVKNSLETFNPISGKHDGLIPGPQETQVWAIVDQVLERYGRFDHSQLASLSHEPGGPWETTRTARLLYISSETIVVNYRQKLDAPHP